MIYEVVNIIILMRELRIREGKSFVLGHIASMLWNHKSRCYWRVRILSGPIVQVLDASNKELSKTLKYSRK